MKIDLENSKRNEGETGNHNKHKSSLKAIKIIIYALQNKVIEARSEK